jgi:hypothetical protein
MTIKRSNADIPEGWHPDPEPRFAGLLAEKWQADNEAEAAAHVSSGALFKASDAGKCARAISYRAAKVPESNPMELTGHHNVTIGRWLHDVWEAAVLERYPDATFEVEHWFLDDRGIVRIDLVIEIDGVRIAYEMKSINGYGFKSAIGKIRRGTPAEGPRTGAILQGAIGGLMVDADEVVVGNLAKETISYDGMAELDRFAAEWTLTREQYEPLARKELERIEGILDLFADGEMAARKIPGVPGVITDPGTGTWQVQDSDGMVLDTGSTWECRYCPWVDLCERTPRGRVKVEDVETLRGELP